MNTWLSLALALALIPHLCDRSEADDDVLLLCTQSLLLLLAKLDFVQLGNFDFPPSAFCFTLQN
jgi:hypothetical protein